LFPADAISLIHVHFKVLMIVPAFDI